MLLVGSVGSIVSTFTSQPHGGDAFADVGDHHAEGTSSDYAGEAAAGRKAVGACRFQRPGDVTRRIQGGYDGRARQVYS